MLEEHESPMRNDWPELPSHNPLPLSLVTPQLGLKSSKSPFTKRHVDASSYCSEAPNGVDCLPSAVKTAKGASTVHDESSLPLPGGSSLHTHSRLLSNFPPFAPRESYVKLSFSGNPSSDTKLRLVVCGQQGFPTAA